MRIYGVSERDMPPHLIIRHGRELGFTHSRIYPMEDELIDILYREPVPPRFTKARRIRIGRLMQALNPSDRHSAIVVMTK